ncbi:MAG: outer membrane beta-barrel protein [Prevotella sp.]|nr:outer membrane beta-barrel protein [Prevotella sp.]
MPLMAFLGRMQAQNQTDTTVTLQEVTVKSRTIIHKLDRTLFLPTRETRRNASNPYELMFNMAMPHVLVDPLTKSLSANGGAVQLRINGVKASQAEVSALLPRDIVRIELIENPGMRYGDSQLGAVVDLIVRNREAGGLVNVQTTNSPIVPFGENMLTAKYNRGHSQWGVSYAMNYRGLRHLHTDREEEFCLGETTVHRVQKGVDDRSDWNDHSVELSYNYMQADRYVFNAVLRNYYKRQPHQDETGLFNGNVLAHTVMSHRNYTPSIDLYFQRNMAHGQTLTFNLTGTLIRSARERNYTETSVQGSRLADVVANVAGRKRSVIAEAVYDRRLGNVSLSAGLRHYQMLDRNKYAGSMPVVSEMRQSRSSFFAELQGQWKKLGYGISAGAMRAWFKENGESHAYVTFMPTVRLTVVPHRNGYLSYRFSTDPQIPSLSDLTDVRQALDTIQIVTGNPQLRTYNVYDQSLSYSYSVGKVMAMMTATYAYHHRPIMESLSVEEGKLLIGQDNQRSYQVLGVAPMIAIRGIDCFGFKNFLTLSLELGYNRYWSSGKSYRHIYNNFYYNALFSLNYKEFALMGQMRKNRDYLLGETVYKGENMTVLMAVWNHKRLQLGAGILFPFVNNYRTGKERLSAIAPYQSWTYARESGNLFLLRLNYHFEFGKAYHAKERRVNNRDTEDGILGM